MKNVTSKTTQSGSRFAPAPLARVVAFLLLVFVTHSATLEVVHQHGNILAAGQAYTASFVDASTDHSSTGSSGSTVECLICQLHQHLFSTLLINIPGIAPPQAEEATATHATVPSLSETRTPRRGRAPPQSSLL